MNKIKLNVGGLLIEKDINLLKQLNYFDSLLSRWDHNKIIDLSDRNPITFLKIIDCLENGGNLKDKYQDDLEFYGITFDKSYKNDENLLEFNKLVCYNEKDYECKNYLKNTLNLTGIDRINLSDLELGFYGYIYTETQEYFKTIYPRHTKYNKELLKLPEKFNNKFYISTNEYMPDNNSATKSVYFRNFNNNSYDYTKYIYLNIDLPPLIQNDYYIKDLAYHIIDRIYVTYNGTVIFDYDGMIILIFDMIYNSKQKNTFSYNSLQKRINKSQENVTLNIEILKHIIPMIYYHQFKFEYTFKDTHEYIINNQENLNFDRSYYNRNVIQKDITLRFESSENRGYILNRQNEHTIAYPFKQIIKSVFEFNNTSNIEVKIKINNYLNYLIIFIQTDNDIKTKNYSNFGCIVNNGKRIGIIDNIKILLTKNGIVNTLTEDVLTNKIPNSLFNNKAPKGIYIISNKHINKNINYEEFLINLKIVTSGKVIVYNVLDNYLISDSFNCEKALISF